MADTCLNPNCTRAEQGGRRLVAMTERATGFCEFCWMYNPAIIDNAAIEAINRGVPFVLSCAGCGAGASDPTVAISDGWRSITAGVEGIVWNFLGVCPACRAEWKREEAEIKRAAKEAKAI